MTAQQRHDAIRKIARDKTISDAEALRQIAKITAIGGEKLLQEHIRQLTKKQNAGKPASQITDRAKRYRANQHKPAGPRRCTFCASRKNVDVDHISGDESDGDPENLMYLCRPHNVTKALIQQRNGIGVRTSQFNPGTQRRVSFKQFRQAAGVLMGERKGDAQAATMLIRHTAPALRQKFAGEISRKNPPTFGQYVHGAVMHARGAHDEGGNIIHATPPALRRKYALEIARIKASRRASEVPF